MLRFKGIILILAVVVAAGLLFSSGIAADSHEGPCIDTTRGIIMGYLYPEDADAIHNYDYVTEDVLFFDMATGAPFATNAQELAEGLYYFYNVIFEIDEIKDLNLMVGEGEAVIEWTLLGTHIGEFAGIPATGKEIEFPMIARYVLQDEEPYLIKEARVYMMINILMEQITS